MGLMISCRQREISVAVLGGQGNALIVRTSYGVRRFPVQSSDLAGAEVRLPLADPLLEQMAFSRGRILVGFEGGVSLVVPAWPEIARVIEDCRAQ
jgi:hypothetical protein